MATLSQAVAVQRMRGTLPSSGPTSVYNLHQIFRPFPPGSMTALLRTMLNQGAQRLPWAVILCRFRGEAPNPWREGPVEDFYRHAFTPGSGGLIEYWRDVSLGAIDIAGSRVFDWVELEIARADAGKGSGATRSTFVNNAIKVLTDKNDPRFDPLTGFHSQIAVLIENWSKDGAPPGADWSNAAWNPYWIDGSADGFGKVTLTPPHDGGVTAHEMGHGFGMQHDVAPDLVTHYADPCCVMSQQNTFTVSAFGVAFGPAVCFPHRVQQGWMDASRVLQDDGSWESSPTGLTSVLAPASDPATRANLGLRLPLAAGWEYLVEYVRPKFWNQGLPGDTLFIRRLSAATGIGSGQTPVFLNKIVVPAAKGVRATLIETTGGTRFEVERFEADGRTVKVTATKP